MKLGAKRGVFQLLSPLVALGVVTVHFVRVKTDAASFHCEISVPLQSLIYFPCFLKSFFKKSEE